MPLSLISLLSSSSIETSTAPPRTFKTFVILIFFEPDSNNYEIGSKTSTKWSRKSEAKKCDVMHDGDEDAVVLKGELYCNAVEVMNEEDAVVDEASRRTDYGD
ncbi:unnamed protein product [Vicia faba]|uniref:Uncharacterized protein n=1 Tax=Vicia faba TaxID=3906 RepID=A0AAV0YSK7_VICFA|nr:unnamed protein product [Vicia faba]